MNTATRKRVDSTDLTLLEFDPLVNTKLETLSDETSNFWKWELRERSLKGLSP